MYVVDETAGGSVSPEEARRQIDVIRASHSFRNEESFQKLLVWLADRTLDGSARSLREYTVGTELFGKPEGYDPGEDATVRIEISRLRQKLEEFYLGEGKHDSVVVEAPRRGMGLVFRRRDDAHELVTAPLPVLLPPDAAQGAKRWRMAASALLIAVMAFFAGRRFAPGGASGTRTENVASEIEEFWRPSLADGRPVLVVVTAAGYGEALAAFELGKLFTGWDSDVRLRPESALTPEDRSGHNLIVLGSGGGPAERTYVIDAAGVVNRNQRAGEPARFGRGSVNGAVIEDYGVVSRLPGVMTLGASSAEGTAAVVDAVTNAAWLRTLFGQVKNAEGDVPAYFEAVVRVEFRAGAPATVRYVTHR